MSKNKIVNFSVIGPYVPFTSPTIPSTPLGVTSSTAPSVPPSTYPTYHFATDTYPTTTTTSTPLPSTTTASTTTEASFEPKGIEAGTPTPTLSEFNLSTSEDVTLPVSSVSPVPTSTSTSTTVVSDHVIPELLSTSTPAITVTHACPFIDYCSKVAGNGICDLRCNIEQCNYDHGDCGSDVETGLPDLCPGECASLRDNGICNQNCNVEVCDFDGSDCANPSIENVSQKETLKDTVSVIVEVVNPTEFNGAKLLSNVRTYLNTPVDLAVDTEGHVEIYESSKEFGRGNRIDFTDFVHGDVGSPLVEVVLSPDFTPCQDSQSSCRFNNAGDFTDFLNTAPIYEVSSSMFFSGF